jgi:hypothetical protein
LEFWFGLALLIDSTKILDLLANDEVLVEGTELASLARFWVLDTFRAVRRSFRNFLGLLKLLINLEVLPDVSSSLELDSYVMRIGDARVSPPEIRAVGAMVVEYQPGEEQLIPGLLFG